MQAAGADFAAADCWQDFAIKHHAHGLGSGALQQGLYGTIQIEFGIAIGCAQWVLRPRDDDGHGHFAQGKGQHIGAVSHGVGAV